MKEIVRIQFSVPTSNYSSSKLVRKKVSKRVFDIYNETNWDSASKPYSISNNLRPSLSTTGAKGIIATGKFLLICSLGSSTL